MGYLLPDVDAIDGEVCVQLRIPNEPAYIRAFWGALTELGNWYVWGAERARDDGEKAEREIVASIWREAIYQSRLDNIPYACPNDEDVDDDDAPFWEPATGALAGENAGQWGYDAIADWAITAFLAVAGSPLAALWYKTSVPVARVAFQTRDAGALVNIFVDGILALTVDTASTVPGVAELVEARIDLVAFATEHDLSGIERIIRIAAAA